MTDYGIFLALGFIPFSALAIMLYTLLRFYCISHTLYSLAYTLCENGSIPTTIFMVLFCNCNIYTHFTFLYHYHLSIPTFYLFITGQSCSFPAWPKVKSRDRDNKIISVLLCIFGWSGIMRIHEFGIYTIIYHYHVYLLDI